MTACVVGCLHKRWQKSVQRTHNATLCYLASGSFYTGISGTVVVVGGSVFLLLCVCWLGSLAVEQSVRGNVPNAWGA
ncbi:MAG: hypothetical protein IPL98_07665 [Saprospiraceae bacterium]|nr:hypothetical protein [Saprospiraceae bacterium]